ncbi:fructosamine kinase family protein [soil metagenome]
MERAPAWGEVARELAGVGGPRLDVATARPVGGGCIHSAWRLDSDEGPCFLKLNSASAYPLFEAEVHGLEKLAAANAVRVPRILGFGATAGTAFLALEWIELARRSPDADRRLGAALADQHRVTHEAFGLESDNRIGSTVQPNGWCSDWVGFFRDRRLRFQLELAAGNGFGAELTDRGERLLGRVDAWFEGHTPPPALLHGDLWAGNAAADSSGRPVIFDPAVYFGDREADLAMTRLFGGFSEAFYVAYARAWPLPGGHEQRIDLYNLYHILNHVNLFGAGYLGQAQGLLDCLLQADA